MIPTMEQARSHCAYLLGDPTKKVFTDIITGPAVQQAVRELYAEMLGAGLPYLELTTTYTLPASTTLLTPATALITNFGELVRMSERPSGSSDKFTPVDAVDALPQWDQDSLLHVYRWANDTWNFVGATGSLELQIVYLSSGNPPVEGSIGIDGCMEFVASRAAAIAGPVKGRTTRAKELDFEARGARLDYRGGHIHSLLTPMVLHLNRVPLQPNPYAAGGLTVSGGRPPISN